MLAEMCIIPQPQPKYCVYRGSTLLFFFNLHNRIRTRLFQCINFTALPVMV